MKPYYEHAGITIYHGDCRELLPLMRQIPVIADVVVTDPPYGETSLDWDQQRQGGWAHRVPSDQIWCFGSLRFFLASVDEFRGWSLAQDVVWEKHNGSSFHADRFKRVHEFAVQFYRGDWASIYKSPVTTPDATARTVRRKERPPHTGEIANSIFVAHDGGPRLMRSVIRARSCHGYAEHPTQKPLEILKPLIEYSCPPDGMVLDTFAGSGSTLVAAKELGRSAIGIEIEERYCEIAAKRLSQEVFQF